MGKFSLNTIHLDQKTWSKKNRNDQKQGTKQKYILNDGNEFVVLLVLFFIFVQFL